MPPIDASIALGAQTPQQQQNPMAGLASLMQIVHMIQQNKRLDAQTQHDTQMLPLQLQYLQSGIEDRNAQVPQHQAAAAKSRIEALNTAGQMEGQNRLMSLFNPQPGSFLGASAEYGLPAAKVVPSMEQALEEALRRDKLGLPVRIGAPAPNELQSALIQADPKAAIGELVTGPRRAEELGQRMEDRRDQRITMADLARDRMSLQEQLAADRAANRPPPRQQFLNTAQGIMQVGEDGIPKPVMGADGKPLMPSAGVSTGNNNALSLSRMYENHPPVKQYNTIAPAVTQAAQYMAAIPKSGATAADDAALTKLYVALTHPKGDQISNLDIRQLLQQPDLPDRVKASISGFINGRMLPDATRAEFWGVINNRFKALDYQNQQKRKEIESRAAAMGLDANAIFGTQ